MASPMSASVAGFDVRLHDISPKTGMNAALATINGNMARQVAKGAIDRRRSPDRR